MGSVNYLVVHGQWCTASVHSLKAAQFEKGHGEDGVFARGTAIVV